MLAPGAIRRQFRFCGSGLNSLPMSAVWRTLRNRLKPAKCLIDALLGEVESASESIGQMSGNATTQEFPRGRAAQRSDGSGDPAAAIADGRLLLNAYP
jgi:hypothetical protein